MIELSIDRTGLSLAPLVITGNPHGTTLYLDEDGITWPSFDTRRTYAPDSAYASGRSLLAAVFGEGDLPVTIYAHGDTGAALAAAQDELADALAQWSYDLTLTVDSVARTYRAEVVLDLPWGPIDSGMVAARIARTSFSIPLNP